VNSLLTEFLRLIHVRLSLIWNRCACVLLVFRLIYVWFRYGVQLPACKRYTQSVAWNRHGL